MSIASNIANLIEGDVIIDKHTREKFSQDASIFKVIPEIVIAPKHTQDIKKIVHYVNEHPEQHLSLTARSGGTCMSGGPLSTSIVLDMQKYMHNIGEVQGHTITTQPGAFYRDFEKKTLTHNLLMPSYPASREICTVGGMVNNNAGGEKTLAYGKTQKYIEELKVILSDGNEYTIKKLSLQELAQKLQQKDFEGDMYRKLVDLIDTNEETITHAKPTVTKNSTGYNLWDIYDGTNFDLTQLFAGSQGTLGITTEITFNLIKPKPYSKMLVIFLKDLNPLTGVITKILRYSPESFESYDRHTLNLAIKFLPGLIKQMGQKNLFTLGLQFIPDIIALFTTGIPELVLLAEFTGDNEEEVTMRANAAKASLKSLPVGTHLTKNAEEAQKYWTIRRESFNLLRHKIKDKHTAPFIDDLTVHPKDLPKFLPRLNEILSHYNFIYTIAGHIGDANFHIIPLMNFENKVERDIIPELSKKVYDLVFEFKGSMSGEHNDGLIRSHFLIDMYGQEVYNLFAKTKHILDPHTIFNPGKKVGYSWEYAKKHIIKK